MLTMAPGYGLPAVWGHCFGAAAAANDCNTYAAPSASPQVPMAATVAELPLYSAAGWWVLRMPLCGVRRHACRHDCAEKPLL